MSKRRTVDAIYLTEWVEQFDTVAEAADMMGLHPGSLGNYVRTGKCAAVVENYAKLLMESESKLEVLLVRASGDKLCALEAFLRAMKIPYSGIP